MNPLGKAVLWGCILVLELSGSGCSGGFPDGSGLLKESWNSSNSPELFDASYEHHLDTLPRRGEAQVRPWSDDYWASNAGSIARRWQGALASDGFSYSLPSEQSIHRSEIDVGVLSPAEKFDIYMGRFDFPTVNSIRRAYEPENPGWWGLCAGVSALSHLYPEPHSVKLTGPSGIAIPFAASDVKALAAYYHAVVAGIRFKIIGEICAGDLDGSACRDVNPGAFHIVLANEVGLRRRLVAVDMDHGFASWNHNIFSFQSNEYASQIPTGEERARGVREKRRFSTRIAYNAFTQPSLESLGSIEAAVSWLSYTLELDGRGQILGGVWDGPVHPDIIWRPFLSEFSGYFYNLKDIFEASIPR